MQPCLPAWWLRLLELHLPAQNHGSSARKQSSPHLPRHPCRLLQQPGLRTAVLSLIRQLHLRLDPCWTGQTVFCGCSGSWTVWPSKASAPSAGAAGPACATAWLLCTPTCWTPGTGQATGPSLPRRCCPPAAARRALPQALITEGSRLVLLPPRLERRQAALGLTVQRRWGASVARSPMIGDPCMDVRLPVCSPGHLLGGVLLVVPGA